MLTLFFQMPIWPVNQRSPSYSQESISWHERLSPVGNNCDQHEMEISVWQFTYHRYWVGLTKKLKFHGILAICSEVKSVLTRQGVGLNFLRLSHVWSLSWPWAHWGLGGRHYCHPGGCIPSGHAMPCCLHWFHAPGCHSSCPWKQSEDSRRVSKHSPPICLGTESI